MSRPPEILYPLLPAFIRSADALQGEPLRALMAVLELQRRAIEEDLTQLYENWFIETCEEWVVPYIADLLGVRGLSGAVTGVFSLRARVANAIAHRRRKGTAAALASVAQDGTGWCSVVVECRDRLARTWSAQDPPGSGSRGTLSLRDAATLKYPAGPLSTAARSADLASPNRSPEDRVPLAGPRGRFNLPNLGVLLWRLQQYPVELAAPRRVGPAAGGYTFSPFGIDRPLFGLQDPPAEAGAAGGGGYPAPLDPRQLTASRGSVRHGLGVPEDGPAVRIFVPRGGSNGGEERAWDEIPTENIAAADLSGWRVPRQPVSRRTEVLVDPALGRLLFRQAPRGEVRVSYAYGFSAELGGGPYARRTRLPSPDAEEQVWQAAVSRDAPVERVIPSGPWEREEEKGLKLYRKLEEALAAWLAATPPRALIRILDSATYDVGELPVRLSSSHRELTIEAASGLRPCLLGNLAFDTRMEKDSAQSPAVTLSGLWIDGQVSVQGGGRLLVSHATLRPPVRAGDHDSLTVRGGEGHRELEVAIEWSIVGRVALPPDLRQLRITDSILDGGAGPAIRGLAGRDGSRGSGPAAVITRTTVFGPVAVLRLNADSSLFTAPVQVRDPWVSAAVFSYLAPGSTGLGSSEHCQPLEGDAAVRPFFTSTRFGDPGYAQLARETPAAITDGGEEGSEMGAFHHLSQPQRLANLPAILAEYVPWGLDAWVELVT